MILTVITNVSLFETTENVQVAFVTGAFALFGIITAGYFAKAGSKPKIPKEDPDANHPATQSLLASYTGEQNAFMHLVIEDSKTVHERLDKFEVIVDQMKKERTQLIGAFTRYINKLVSAWGSGGKMPYPDEEDFKILEETLPSDWRHRIK